MNKDVQSETKENLTCLTYVNSAKALLTGLEGFPEKRHPAQRCSTLLTIRQSDPLRAVSPRLILHLKTGTLAKSVLPAFSGRSGFDGE